MLVERSLHVRTPGFIDHHIFGRIDLTGIENPVKTYFSGPEIDHLDGLHRLAFDLHLAVLYEMLEPSTDQRTEKINVIKLARALRGHGMPKLPNPAITNPEVFLLARRKINQKPKAYEARQGLYRLAREVGFSHQSLWMDLRPLYPELAWGIYPNPI